MTLALVPSKDIKENLFKKFSRKFNPIFHFLGEWYGYVLGILLWHPAVAAPEGFSGR